MRARCHSGREALQQRERDRSTHIQDSTARLLPRTLAHWQCPSSPATVALTRTLLTRGLRLLLLRRAGSAVLLLPALLHRALLLCIFVSEEKHPYVRIRVRELLLMSTSNGRRDNV